MALIRGIKVPRKTIKFDCIFRVVVESSDNYWVRIEKNIWWCILPTGERKRSYAEAPDALILDWLFKFALKPVEKKMPFEEIWWLNEISSSR